MMMRTTEPTTETATTLGPMSADETDETDEIARVMLRRLEDAWNSGDGEAYGAPYDETASFVNIRGELHRGADIGIGHSMIFATTHAGSVNRMELLDARRLADDVIVVTSRNTLDAPQGPLAGVHSAMSTSVLVRYGSTWRIAATHNTLVGAL